MADPEGGTPEQKPPDIEKGGTGEQKPDGTENQGKGLPNESPELVAAWKAKAERTNQLEQELERERQARASLERQNLRPQEDVLARDFQVLQDMAQNGSESEQATARLTWVAIQQTQRANAEAALARGLLDVPADKRNDVEKRVRESNYQVNIESALNEVSGRSVKSLEERLKELEDKNKRLTEQMEKRGAGAGTAVPAASEGSRPSGDAMPSSEYSRIVRAGGAQARELMLKRDKGEIVLDYGR